MADVLEIIGPLANFLSSEAIIYVTLLRKCIRCKSFLMGRLALAHLVKLGYKLELFISNIVLDVCSKSGFLDDGAKLFDEMPQRDLISWCTIISGYVSHGFDMEAYGLLKRMLESGLMPNHFVISSVLKACSAARFLELGVLVHCWATNCGLVFDRFVEVGLVSMYTKCGSLNDAIKLFYEIPVKTSISWNVIVLGCIQSFDLNLYYRYKTAIRRTSKFSGFDLKFSGHTDLTLYYNSFMYLVRTKTFGLFYICHRS